MWDPDRPINELPEGIRSLFSVYAGFMYSDLVSREPPVVRVPSNHYVGATHDVLSSQNPEWYRDMYHEHPHFRRDRSLRALMRIQSYLDQPFNSGPYKYDARYRELIQQFITEGFEEQGWPAMDEVRVYFGMEPLEEIVIAECPGDVREENVKSYDAVPF